MYHCILKLLESEPEPNPDPDSNSKPDSDLKPEPKPGNKGTLALADVDASKALVGAELRPRTENASNIYCA